MPRSLVPAVLFALISISTSLAQDDAADDFGFAAGLHDRGLHDRAVKAFERYLERFPDDDRVPRARFYLGESLVALERDAEALPHFEAHARDRRATMRTHAVLRSGEILLRLGKAAEAYERLAPLLDRSDLGEIEEATLYFFAESAVAAAHPEAASAAYRRLLSSHPDGTYRRHAAIALGVLELEAGRLEESRALLTPVADGEADDGLASEASLLLGEAWMKDDQPRKALRSFRRASRGAPRRARLGEARALLSSGAHEEAVRALTRCMAEHPGDAGVIRASVRAAAVLREAGKQALGLTLLAAIEGARGQDAEDIAYWRGLLASDGGDLGGGIEDLERAVASGGTPQRRFSLADALSRAGRFEKAAEIFASIRRSDADVALRREAIFAEGFALCRLEKHARAAVLFEALDADDVSPDLRRDAVFAAAEAAFATGRHEDAALRYRRCTEDEHPRRLDAAYKLGWCEYRLGRMEPALAALDTVLESKSGEWRAEALFLQGKCLEQLGRDESAREVFEKLGALRDGGNTAARGLLGASAAARRQGDHAAARKLAGRAGKLATDDDVKADAAWAVAEASYEAGDFDAAAKAYRRFLDDHPEHERVERARLALAWALRDGGDVDGSVEAASAAADSRLAEVAGEACYLAGLGELDRERYDEALRHLGVVRRRYSAHARAPEAELAWAIAAARSGRNTAAAEAFADHVARGKDHEGRDVALYEWAFVMEAAGDEAARDALLRRLVAEHPGSSRAADASFRVAESLYAKGEYEQAMRLYAGIAEGDAEGVLTDQAIYKVSWCLRRLERHADAATSFARLAERERSEFAAESCYLAGDGWSSAGNHEAALACFRLLGKRHGDHEHARAASLRQVLELAALGRHAEVTRLSPRVLGGDAEGPWELRVRSALGDALFASEKWKRAATAYRAVTRSTAGPLAARAQYRIGVARDRDGDRAGAIDELLKVAILYAHEPWVARATVDAAELFERDGEVEKARRLYEDVVEKHRKTEEADRAAAGLTRLKQSEGK